jgi:hypothetical protein
MKKSSFRAQTNQDERVSGRFKIRNVEAGVKITYQ